LLLLTHGILQRDIDVRRAIHLERVSGEICRLEERKTLNVIPVKVGKKESSLSLSLAKRGPHEFVAQNSKACSPIQDQQVVTIPEGNTGRIPSILHRIGTWDRNGTPHAIILNLHE
jgi:hypothetical protein